MQIVKIVIISMELRNKSLVPGLCKRGDETIIYGIDQSQTAVSCSHL